MPSIVYAVPTRPACTIEVDDIIWCQDAWRQVVDIFVGNHTVVIDVDGGATLQFTTWADVRVHDG